MKARWPLLCAALIVPLLATPSLAQDIVYFDAGTAHCMTNPQRDFDQRFCIGTSAEACMDATENGWSVPMRVRCLMAEHAYWEERLRIRYVRATEAARAADAESPGAMSAEGQLREMQDAWRAYRDRTCAYEFALKQDSAESGPAAALCRMRLTGLQAQYLAQKVAAR